MRAMLAAATSLAICGGLFGCDRTPQAPVAAPVVAAAPSCNCQQPIAPAPVVQTVHRHRQHRHWSEHEYASYESYGSSSMSSSSESNSSEEHQAEASMVATLEAASATHAEGKMWVDGYGRGHAMAADAVAENPAALTAEDGRKRLAPWHAYDSKCTDKRG